MPAITDRLKLEAAAKLARATAIAKRQRSLEQLKHLLLVLAGEVRDELDKFGGVDGRIPAAALPTLRAYLDGRLSTFSDRWKKLIDEGLTAAAKIGASLLELVGREGGDAAVVGQVLEYVRTFRAADGLTLSNRIWRVEEGTREALRVAIENAVARGESASQAAERYLRDGIPVPEHLRAAIGSASASAITRSVKELLQTAVPGNPAYNLERLLRTEMNRAYTESYVATVAQHPDVIGVKFNLSPLHPKTDICDLYAEANLHGLGKGVYPPGAHPYPAHPNTLSFLTTVWRDEVTEADRTGREDAFAWIARRPSDEQDQILGGNRKGAAFRSGLLKAGELRMPWYAIAARLGITDPEPNE